MKKKKAEQWLSRHMDGELSPRRTRRLEMHLHRDAEGRGVVQTWAELGEVMRAREVSPGRSAEDTWDGVQQALAADDVRRRSVFPGASFLWQPTWAIASIALVAVIAGIGAALLLRGGAPGLVGEAMAEADVEWVESDLPNAVTVVYEDEETGWTIIWVDAENGNGHAGS